MTQVILPLLFALSVLATLICGGMLFLRLTRRSRVLRLSPRSKVTPFGIYDPRPLELKSLHKPKTTRKLEVIG